MNKLAIITPTRNAAEYLVECIDSVRAQKVPDGWEVEHIFVDSGSVDDTLSIADRKGVRVEHVEPIGVSHSLNSGIERADADLLGFIGGDDTMLADTATFVTDWYSTRTNDLLTGTTAWIDAQGRSLGNLRAAPSWMTLEMYASLEWSCMNMQSVFYTPELWESIGGFDESYQHSLDFEFLARSLNESGFDRTPRPLCTYRIHGDQISMAPNPDRWSENEEIIDRYAPADRSKRLAYKYLMKVWLNANSPSWFLHKKLPGRTRAIVRQA